MSESDRQYQRIVTYLAETAWAMHPAALLTIRAIVAERRSGNRPSTEEIRRRVALGRERRADAEPVPAIPSVAVISIDGPIVPKADLFTEMSGGAAIVSLQAQLRAALADDTITAIVLNVDSPGGSADLVPEFAAEVFAARGVKPIVAVANTWAASAAYWIASAADELVVTPSGQVGSIGVYLMHQDFSKQLEMEGVDTTLIHAGDYKVEGNPFEPLGEEAEAELQSKVDHYYRMFTGAVAKHRGTDVETVLEEFGQGRMVVAKDAVKRGMADRVATLEDTIGRLLSGKRSTTPEDLEVRDRVGFYRSLRREERRPVELRDRLRPEIRATDDGPVIEGYACVYDVEYAVFDRWGEYTESVAPGAATKTLRENPDVRYLVNHEGVPLARTASGTLELTQREDGIWYTTQPLDMRNPKAQELVSAVSRGDIDGSSFAFRTTRQEWSEDYTRRRILEIALHDGDVSTVTFPANPHASSGLRARDLVHELATAELDELLVEARGRDELTGQIAMAAGRLQEVLDELGGGRPETRRDSPATLSIQKARRELELLELGTR